MCYSKRRALLTKVGISFIQDSDGFRGVIFAFDVVFETRKDSNESRRVSIPQDRPASAVKPRSLFSAAIRERASTSAYADPRS